MFPFRAHDLHDDYSKRNKNSNREMLLGHGLDAEQIAVMLTQVLCVQGTAGV